jgi:hypothetical protein
VILASDKKKCPVLQQCHLNAHKSTDNRENILSVYKNLLKIYVGLPLIPPFLLGKIREQAQCLPSEACKRKVFLYQYWGSPCFLNSIKLDVFSIQTKKLVQIILPSFPFLLGKFINVQGILL